MDSPELSLFQATDNLSRKEAAQFFLHVLGELVLALLASRRRRCFAPCISDSNPQLAIPAVGITKKYITVEQEMPYGDINIQFAA